MAPACRSTSTRRPRRQEQIDRQRRGAAPRRSRASPGAPQRRVPRHDGDGRREHGEEGEATGRDHGLGRRYHFRARGRGAASVSSGFGHSPRSLQVPHSAPRQTKSNRACAWSSMPLVVGQHAQLEVAPPVALRAEPRAGEVGAAEVEERAVDRDHLHVDARAGAHLEARRRRGARRARPAPAGTGRKAASRAAGARGPPVAKRLERVEDGHVAPARPVARADGRLGHELLHVRGRDPHRGPRPRDRERHVLVMRPIHDEGQRRAAGFHGDGSACILPRTAYPARHATTDHLVPGLRGDPRDARTMAWADGRFEASERASVLAAAGVLNLSKDLRERLNEVVERPVPVDRILFDTLSVRDRAFAYVAAMWMAGVDEDIDPKEEELLDRAAAILGFSPARKAELERHRARSGAGAPGRPQVGPGNRAAVPRHPAEARGDGRGRGDRGGVRVAETSRRRPCASPPIPSPFPRRSGGKGADTLPRPRGGGPRVGAARGGGEVVRIATPPASARARPAGCPRSARRPRCPGAARRGGA